MVLLRRRPAGPVGLLHQLGEGDADLLVGVGVQVALEQLFDHLRGGIKFYGEQLLSVSAED